MRRRFLVAVSGLMVIGSLMVSQSASAATTVGNTCTANKVTGAVSATLFGVANATGPATMPAGVISSWTINGAAGLPAGVFYEAQLKILKPTGVPQQFSVVGESTPSKVGAGPNTLATRIPVQAGDLIGVTGLAGNGSITEPAIEYCETGNPGDIIGAALGTAGVGGTLVTKEEVSKYAVPITVKVEPDADGDGYGDETQDLCPTNATTQAACPVPVVTTLSGTAAAKKGLIQVSLTASAQATVTVGGTAKLGKGKSAKLSGGTQIVAPGTLAKFTVVFPSKLKKALKQTPTAKKLTVKLSATAPGATSTTLTVKVKGQMKPKPKHGKS